MMVLSYSSTAVLDGVGKVAVCEMCPCICLGAAAAAVIWCLVLSAWVFSAWVLIAC